MPMVTEYTALKDSPLLPVTLVDSAFRSYSICFALSFAILPACLLVPCAQAADDPISPVASTTMTAAAGAATRLKRLARTFMGTLSLPHARQPDRLESKYTHGLSP